MNVASTLSVNGAGVLAGSASGQINLASNLVGSTTNAQYFNPQGAVLFDGSGTASSPQTLEAMSNDQGAAQSGFENNFAYGTLGLANNTYVKLVDLSNNSGSTAEAIYVNDLIVPAGSTLDLNGLQLYAHSMQVSGTILNGSVALVVTPQANLTIGLSAPTTINNTGANLTYTITVSNTGSGDAQNVSISDLLPAGLIFVSQSQTSGPAFFLYNSGNQVTDEINVLTPGSSATFNVVAQVAANNVTLLNTVIGATSSSNSNADQSIESVSTTISASATTTATTLAASATSVSYGQTVTLMATITSDEVPNIGIVTFVNGATVLGTAPVHDGVATLNNVVLPGGADVITASFSDTSGIFAGSTSNATTVVVNYPDLQATGLAFGPSSVLQSGGQVTLNWNDSNPGSGAAIGGWSDYISVVNTTTGQPVFTAAPFYSANNVAAGGSMSRSINFTLPNGLPGVGQLQITVTADYAGSLLEYNPDGTPRTVVPATLSGTSTLAVYPDLQATGHGIRPFEPMLRSGGDVTLNWSDANPGSGAAIGGWSDYISVVNTTTGQPVFTAAPFYSANNVAAGGSIPRSINFTLPNGVSGVGQLQVTITADSNNSLLEYNPDGTPRTVVPATLSGTSTLAVYPDLQATGLAFGPSSVLRSGGARDAQLG